MKPWSAFYDYVLPDVPGCGNLAADVALRQSAQAFCNAAKVWRETLDATVVEAGNYVYDFDIGHDQEVVEIIEARLDGAPYAVQRDRRGKTGLRYVDGQTFELGRGVPVGAALTLDVVLRPAPNAYGVEDDIYTAHSEALASGAKARLMRSPKKPYTDFNLAQLHEQHFASAVERALLQRFYGYGPTWARVSPQFM